MMNQGSILVLLQMEKKEAADILVAEQGEAECISPLSLPSVIVQV